MTNYKKGQAPKLPHYAALRTPGGDFIYKEPKKVSNQKRYGYGY